MLIICTHFTIQNNLATVIINYMSLKIIKDVHDSVMYINFWNGCIKIIHGLKIRDRFFSKLIILNFCIKDRTPVPRCVTLYKRISQYIPIKQFTQKSSLFPGKLFQKSCFSTLFFITLHNN